MSAIFNKELKQYFTGGIGYVFCALMLAVSGIFIAIINLKSAYSAFEYAVANMTYIYLVVIPILTMRIMAEEKRQKTDQLLFSLPLRTTDIVLGKYFAALVVLAIPLAIICLYPPILSQFGTINFRTAYSCLAAYYLLGACLISVGMFISSLTENQIVAAIISFIVLLINFFIPQISSYVSSSVLTTVIAFIILIVIVAVILYFTTKNPVLSLGVGIILAGAMLVICIVKSSLLEGLLPTILSAITAFDKFDTFAQGQFNLTSVFFYISGAAVFQFLTVQSLEKRRWA